MVALEGLRSPLLDDHHIPHAHGGDQAPETVRLTAGRCAERIPEQRGGAIVRSGEEILDPGLAVVSGGVGPPTVELPPAERQDAGVPHPEDSERGRLHLGSQEAE